MYKSCRSCKLNKLEKLIHYHIKVKGRVQGVGFRAFTASTAKALGIKGFVQNKPDGTVYIEAEGDLASMADFIKMCSNGPGWSHVDHLTQEVYPVRGYTAFEIRY